MIKDIVKDLDKDVFSNFYNSFDRAVRFQLFKTHIHDGDLYSATRRHKIEMMNAIVYSKYQVMKSLTPREEIYSMSGFKERTGRMPNSNDKIKIIRGNYYFTVVGEYMLSEIYFEIINN